jgi:uncharacterized protein YeaO (DUF488 family)
MDIRIKRVYEQPDPGDGIRILVDRLWPRGLSKEAAKIDYWAKMISPSSELRKWFGHDPAKWVEFQQRYAAELNGQAEEVAFFLKKIEQGTATFLYGSTEKKLNNAHALKLYLEKSENLMKLPQDDELHG